MEIEKLLNETNLKWQEGDKVDISSMANNIFESYKQSLVFGKYKGISQMNRINQQATSAVKELHMWEYKRVI